MNNKYTRTIPPELLNIIKDFHHCEACLISNNKLIYCDICDKNKVCSVYKICKNCDNLDQTDTKKYLINQHHFNYCMYCNEKLIKLAYCQEFEEIDLNYNKFTFNKISCNTCGMETLMMNKKIL